MTDSDPLREALLGKIKSFLLTYDENQLIHSSRFRLVVRSVDSKRRVFTAVLLSIGLFWLVMALLAVRAGEAPIFSGAMAGLFGFWAWARIRRIRALYRVLAKYLEASPEEDVPDSFGKELQLGFRLEYSDYQLIRAGRELDVVVAVIRRRRKNAFQFLVYGFIFGLSQSSLAGAIGGTIPGTAILGFLLGTTPFLIGLAIEFLAIDRLKRLRDKYVGVDWPSEASAK